MYSPISRNQKFFYRPPIYSQWDLPDQPYRSQPIHQGQYRVNGVHQSQWGPYFNPYQGEHPYPYVNSYYTPPVQGYQEPQSQQPSYSDLIFQNPLLSEDEPQTPYNNIPYQNQEPYFHPYPKASFLAKPPTGVQSVLNSFKSQDGTLDINKMVDTAGQMINAVSQVSSVVKGIGGIFKV